MRRGRGGGVFGEFALPNFIIPCEVIGVQVQKYFFLGGEGRPCVRLPDERCSEL